MTNEFQDASLNILSDAAIIDYLKGVQERGFTVVREKDISNECYSIVLDSEGRRASIRKRHDRIWHIYPGGPLSNALSPPPHSITELERILGPIIDTASEVPGGPPKNKRLRPETPLSNLRTLISLCGGRKVTKILDVYFNNPSLTTLSDLLSLGLELAPTVHVITYENNVKKQQLTESVLNKFRIETNITLEVRTIPHKGHMNRLLFLSDGHIVSLGASLNHLETNEIPHLTTDENDSKSFDAYWQSGKPFVY